jgi:hypothetical protein
MILEYAAGAAQDAIAPVADFLAPTVPVAVEVGRYKKYTQKNRFHIPDSRRSPNGRAVEITWTAEDKTYNCQPHAIDVPVDILEEAETQDIENMFKEGAEMAAEVGGLEHEKNVIDAALAAAVTRNVNWGAGNDPIADLDKACLDILKAAKYGSLMGIRVLFGASALMGLKNHPLVRGRYIVSAGTTGVAPMAAITKESIGQILIGVPETRTSFMVYDSAGEGVPENIQFVLDNQILVFAAKESPTRRDPSFMKTFRLANQWMVPGSYLRDDQRVTVQKFDWSEDIEVTNSLAGIQFSINWTK